MYASALITRGYVGDTASSFAMRVRRCVSCVWTSGRTTGRCDVSCAGCDFVVSRAVNLCVITATARLDTMDMRDAHCYVIIRVNRVVRFMCCDKCLEIKEVRMVCFLV